MSEKTTEELIDLEIDNQIKYGDDLADEKITEDKYHELMEASAKKLENLNEKVALDNEVDASLTPVQLEAAKYNERRKDGLAFRDALNAELNLSGLDESVKKLIDDFFKDVKYNLANGDWKSAQREINTLDPTPFADADLISRIKMGIDGYVLKSYT